MTRKPKPVRAWAVVNRCGRVLAIHRLRKAADEWFARVPSDRIVRYWATPNPPKRAAKKRSKR